jgi:lipoprotein NlpD
MRRLVACRVARGAGTTLLALWLAGCASPRPQPAPVEDRGAKPAATTPAAVVAPAAAPGTAPAAPASTDPAAKPGAENAGKPGYYTVKPGDTLIRVGLESGQNWRDIARWNGIDNPNLVEVGQVLRVAPPGVDPAAPATRGVSVSKVEARPLDSRPTPPASAPAAAGAVAPAAPTAPTGSAPSVALPPLAPPPIAVPPVAAATPTAPAPAATKPAAPAREPDEDLNWAWPAEGPLLSGFDEVNSKGLAISGKAGDSVLAAADGRVVYAGSGLRGYGNLVIVKHNSTYLTAYAHNRALLVKEDQVVRRGQKIAEMGSSDADRVKLHFEIRRQGKPIDPARLLPPR